MALVPSTVNFYKTIEKTVDGKIIKEQILDYELLEHYRENKMSTLKDPEFITRLESAINNAFPEYVDTDPLEESLIPEQRRIFHEEHGQEVYTGIVEKMIELCDMIDADIKNIIKPRFSLSERERYMLEDDEEDFYSKRVYTYADLLKRHIDGLITRDRYEPSMFGNYKRLHVKIHEAEKNRDRLLWLSELVICALSAIPMQVRQREVETVEPEVLRETR